MRLSPLRLLALIALSLMLVGGFESMYVRIYRADRQQLGRTFAELPYRKMPGLRRLVLAARERTEPGSTIVLDVGIRDWNGGYAYAYYRASYLLAGRRLVPLVLANRPYDPSRIRSAQYILCWRTPLREPGFKPVLETADGVLARRIR